MIEGRSRYGPGAGAGAHTPGTYVFVAYEDIAARIDEGDVDGIGHQNTYGPKSSVETP